MCFSDRLSLLRCTITIGCQNAGSDSFILCRLTGPSTTITYYRLLNREQLATPVCTADSATTISNKDSDINALGQAVTCLFPDGAGYSTVTLLFSEKSIAKSRLASKDPT